MRVAITGASGFLGKYVLRQLTARGLYVTAISRTPQYMEAPTQNFRAMKLDLAQCSQDSFDEIGRPDVLIHLAWDGLPNYQSMQHIEHELRTQQRFLTNCVNSGLKRLVVSGTCFEYGLTSGELSEDMPANPITAYGKAKNLIRRELQSLQSVIPFELAWLRLFYLFGDGQSSKSLYSLLQAAIARGDHSFDMSGGEQLRDYLPVEEAARLITEISIRRGNAGIVNVCSGQPISVRKLVERWIEQRRSTITMNLGKYPYPEFEPMSFWGARSKLNELLRES